MVRTRGSLDAEPHELQEGGYYCGEGGCWDWDGGQERGPYRVSQFPPLDREVGGSYKVITF